MDINSLSLHFLYKYPRDAARILEKFESEILAQYLAHLPVRAAAVVLKYIIPSIASECLKQMTEEQAASIITHLDMERAAMLLRRVQEDKREQLIKATSPLFANMVRLVLRYPDGTVGQAMDPDIFTVHQDMRVAEVITAVRNAAGLLQHEIYVINDRQEPSGIVAARQLLTSDDMETMKNIMRPVGDTLAARTSLAAAQNSVHWEHRDSIPVVDHQGMFIGVLHRRSLHTKGVEYNARDEYTGTALAVAELFWDVCAHLLQPVQDNEDKRTQNERSD
jgi:magnesium transporter